MSEIVIPSNCKSPVDFNLESFVVTIQYSEKCLLYGEEFVEKTSELKVFPFRTYVVEIDLTRKVAYMDAFVFTSSTRTGIGKVQTLHLDWIQSWSLSSTCTTPFSIAGKTEYDHHQAPLLDLENLKKYYSIFTDPNTTISYEHTQLLFKIKMSSKNEILALLLLSISMFLRLPSKMESVD